MALWSNNKRIVEGTKGLLWFVIPLMSHLSPFPAPFWSLFLDNAPFFFFFRFLFSCSKWQNLKKKAVLSKRQGPWTKGRSSLQFWGTKKGPNPLGKFAMECGKKDSEKSPVHDWSINPPWRTEIAGLMIRAYENHWFPLIRPAIEPLGGYFGISHKYCNNVRMHSRSQDASGPAKRLTFFRFGDPG